MSKQIYALAQRFEPLSTRLAVQQANHYTIYTRYDNNYLFVFHLLHFKDSLEIFKVVVLEVDDLTATRLNALLDGKVHALIPKHITCNVIHKTYLCSSALPHTCETNEMSGQNA